MCGTDGTTYASVCVLRSLSANARVDYRGECIDSDGEVAQDICALVQKSGRCADLTDCETVIIPDDGCCPVCGEFGIHACMQHLQCVGPHSDYTVCSDILLARY